MGVGPAGSTSRPAPSMRFLPSAREAVGDLGGEAQRVAHCGNLAAGVFRRARDADRIPAELVPLLAGMDHPLGCEDDGPSGSASNLSTLTSTVTSASGKVRHGSYISAARPLAAPRAAGSTCAK